jgi:hypothetical protein
VGAGVASCSDGLGEQRLGSLVRAKSPWGGLMGRKEWMRRSAWPVDNTASERGRQCRCQKGGLSHPHEVPGILYWPLYHVPYASAAAAALGSHYEEGSLCVS